MKLLQSTALALLMLGILVLQTPTCARAPTTGAAVAVAGIVEGPVKLIRLSARLALVEGLALQNEDIIETAPGAFVQIEFEGGDRLGVGENTSLMLLPHLPHEAQTPPPRAYLLQGWLKITAAENRATTTVYRLPEVDVWSPPATLVLQSNPPDLAVFVESGSVKLQFRNNRQAGVPVLAGQYGSGQPNAKWSVAARPAADFIQRIPVPFRDTLPARAARYAEQKPVPKALGEISYDEVAPWLRAETMLRLSLLERWHSRVADKTFRAGVIANLAAHPEWERVVYPERFCVRHADGHVNARDGCRP